MQSGRFNLRGGGRNHLSPPLRVDETNKTIEHSINGELNLLSFNCPGGKGGGLRLILPNLIDRVQRIGKSN